MPDFQILARETRKHPWKDVVEKHLGSKAAYAWSVSDHCAIAPLLATPTPCQNALVTHCGAGTHALVLSDLCEKIYATDPNPHAVRFAHLRAKQSNRLNITAFVGPPTRIFRPHTFDLVVTAMPFEHTELANLIGLLNPGGRLCVSCANAFAIKKTNTSPAHTKRALLRCIQKHALSNIELYAAFPSHEDVRTLIDVHDKRSFVVLQHMPYLRHIKTHFFKRIAHQLFVHFLAGGYWCYATRQN